MKKQLIIDIITVLLILLFVYTGLSKLLTPGILKMDLGKHEQPATLRSLATPLAYLIPSVELIIAVLLCIPRFKKWGFLGASILMSVFTVYVGYILFFFSGIHRPCTCGGIFRELTWETHFFINIFYTVIAIAGLILEKRATNYVETILSL